VRPATEIALPTRHLRTLYAIDPDDNVRRTELFHQRSQGE
jgi:hypothetical protein